MPRQRTWLFPLGLSLAWMLSCGGCKEQPARHADAPQVLAPGPVGAPEADAGRPSRAKPLPKGSESDSDDTSLLRFAGEMDVKNRYVSTVMLSLKDPMSLPDCSGILLAPRLVLTAGSCVCGLSTGTSRRALGSSRVDASSCEQRVLVSSVVYGQVGNPQHKERTTQMEFHTSAGAVHPHPELELVLDKRGGVVESRADLATIVLDEPMEEEFREVFLPRDEVQVGESLVMAGFGHDEIVGGFHGVRYYRTNKVMSVQASDRGRIRYEQQGASTYNGYDGGPCFHEQGGHEWLVGVAGARVSGELVCTSTQVYRDWLIAEIQRVEPQKKSPARP